VQLIEEEAAAERVRIYGFLAGVFCSAPTAESVHAVSQMALTLGISCPEGLSLGELEREFMDLFVVPNPRYVAPYESVYRDRWLLEPASGTEAGMGPAPLVMERLLMGESTMAVRQAYLQVGVLPEEDLPDHIANELRFMAHLWAREAEADGEAPALADLRQRFREEHLLKWIGQLRERVAERDRLGYYCVALEVAEAVLRNDAD
jgi:TorA maturation chaperone TorD